MPAKKRRAIGLARNKYRYTTQGLQRANYRLFDQAKADIYDLGVIGDVVERRFNDSYLYNLDYHSFDKNTQTNNPYRCVQILNQLSSNDQLHHKIMSQCQMAYYDYGIIKVIIDLYADFATEGLQIVHPDRSVNNFIQAWGQKIKLKERVNRFFADLFLNANLFIYRSMANLTSQEEQKMKRSYASAERIDSNSLLLRGKDNEDDIVVSPNIVIDQTLMSFTELKSAAINQARACKNIKVKSEGQSRQIPWEYTSLSPLNIETRDRDLGNQAKWVFVLNKQMRDSIVNFLQFVYNKGKNEIEVRLPKKLSNKLREYKGKRDGAFSYEVELFPDEVYVIQDKKFDHWSWSIPFIYPALKHLRYKDCLRSMEVKVCKSVINSVTLWTLGDPEQGIYPEDEHFERLADMLQQPGQSMNIIWPAPIDAKVIEPKLSNMLDPRKHEAVDKDILNALGVPDILLGGRGSNFSNSFISVATTLQKLETARNKIEGWLLNELKLLSDAMGFRKLPKIQWKRGSLRDRKAEQQFKISLFDRGIISAEALLNEAGEDLNIEVERQKNEKRIADKTGVGVLDKNTPYHRITDLIKFGIMPPGWVPERNLKQEMNNKPESKNNFENNNGRPPGKEDTMDRKDREAEPRGIETVADFIRFSSLREEAVDLMSKIESQLKQLTKGRVSEDSIYSIMSKIDNEGDIENVEDDGIIERDIGHMFNYLQDLYKLKNTSNKLKKSDRVMLFANAWAISKMV